MAKRKVAIVIGNYNGYEDTMRCLDSLSKSLLKSSFRDFFVVLVDDCSEEKKSKELPYHISEKGYDAEDSLGLIYTQSISNMGFAGANNIGIKTALMYEPEYVLLLNNDTIVLQDSIEKLVAFAEKNKNEIITPLILWSKDEKTIYSAGGRINKQFMNPENIGMGIKKRELFKESMKCDFVSFCCALIPSKVFESTGLLDTDYYMYSEDVDFCYRAKAENIGCSFCPDAVIFHKDGGTGVGKSTRGKMYGIRNECIIREKYLEGGIRFNRKLYRRTQFEYILRKILFQENKDNTIYYRALKAYMKGSRGREPQFDNIDG